MVATPAADPVDQPAMEAAPAVQVNDFAPADAGVAVDDAGFAVAPEAPAGDFMPGPDTSVFPNAIEHSMEAPADSSSAVTSIDHADSPDTEA